MAQPPAAPQAAIRAQLEARVQHSPADATAWRLLGKLRRQAGDVAGAADALRRAAQLDPESAAAQFDLAQALLASDQPQAAVAYFERVVELAPESDYGRQAQAQLTRLRPQNDSQVKQAGYEIKRFERAEIAERIIGRDREELPGGTYEPLSPWSLRLESGFLYNTNVALSPTNRELDPNPRESFQAFLNPEIEYSLVDTGPWRLGPAFTGYFTANESDFDDLNLESYQPGAFVEHTVALDEGVLVPRVQYDYTLDRFGGVDFGQRHAMSVSMHHLHPWIDRLLYWTTDHTDFADDGATPELSSRDGWTHTVGLEHTLHLAALDVGLGIELQRADVQGRDFRYNGIGISGDVGICLCDGLKLLLTGGIGYRDYPDAEIDPSRNELFWHAASELRWQLTEHWSASLTASYERFDSENELFTADRFVGGVTTALEF
jgi:hypothetical protein